MPTSCTRRAGRSPQLGPLALACLRATGTPVVQTEHGTFDRAQDRLLGTASLARRLSGRLTARTIVHTQADLDRTAPLLGGRARVIPHGEYGGLARSGGAVERERARAALGLAPDVPATLMFGQLRSDKGLDDLAQAVAQVPGLQLLVGGQDIGGLAAARERLDALGARVSVREGFLDMRETAQLFAAADTVALPYKQASQSGVLLLAYGFARAVVVYPSGGLRRGGDRRRDRLDLRAPGRRVADGGARRQRACRHGGVPAPRPRRRASRRRALRLACDRASHGGAVRGGAPRMTVPGDSYPCRVLDRYARGARAT